MNLYASSVSINQDSAAVLAASDLADDHSTLTVSIVVLDTVRAGPGIFRLDNAIIPCSSSSVVALDGVSLAVGQGSDVASAGCLTSSQSAGWNIGLLISVVVDQ